LIYNNLLYLLIVILIFSTKSIPDSSLFSSREVLVLFLCKGYIFYCWARSAHRNGRTRSAKDYFSAEQKFSILAILFYAVDIYLLDIKYFLSFLSLNERFPVLVSLAGVCLFFFYLALMWETSRKSYQFIFERKHTRKTFLLSNVMAILPIVLPWLILSLLFDILQLLPFPFLKRPSVAQWSEPILLLTFMLILAVVFPALIKRLWNCTSLPAGPLRSHIEKFCREHDFTYTDIMLWPLFEGKVITAGIMGISKRLRYLLITPALIEVLNAEELDAVISHEIGHAKKHHLQLYLVLFIGFGILVSFVADPMLFMLLSTDFFYQFTSLTGEDMDASLAFWGTVPLLLTMIVYFRFIFGFFMRNFERQADLYAFETMHDSKPLISSLEKIAWLSGNIRDLPSWHHFGIGQRVDFLKKCESEPLFIKKHDRKVFFSLLVYLVLLVAGVILTQSVSMDTLQDLSKNKFTEAALKKRMNIQPHNALWPRLMGDLKQEIQDDTAAVEYYEKALHIDNGDPDLLNNYAWLLAMSKSTNVFRPSKALELAKAAVSLKPEGYILDTLATAYWVNGFLEKALETEKKATTMDPANSRDYKEQMAAFSRQQKI